ncbi:MAG: hypothetical protein ACRDEA_19875, partial [Microcystaceae cyanobacterium]
VYVESRQAYDQWLVSVAQKPMEVINSVVAQEQTQPPKTLFKTGWYTGLPHQNSIANSLKQKDGGS